jgi:hypothetical protein
LEQRKVFLTSAQEHEKQSKNRQMGLYESKTFCTAKKTINRVKRQPTEWDKTFSNYTFDRELVSRIYKKLQVLNRKVLKMIKNGQ